MRTRWCSPSTATDPGTADRPDVARNGQIYNVWTLNLKNGELRQYTDAVSGNLYTTVFKDGTANPKIGIVTYYKGEYELHALDNRDPIVTAASSDLEHPGRSSTSRRRCLTPSLRTTKRRRASSRRCSWTAARRSTSV